MLKSDTGIIGLDPSLTSFGIAPAYADEPLVIKSKLRGAARLVEIRDMLEIYLLAAELAVMEGYNHGAKRGATSLSQLGELGGVIRVLMYENSVPWVEVAPATLKLFATGSGKADPKKQRIIQAAQRYLGYKGKSGDEADALWLREMGRQAYSHPKRIAMPEERVEHILELLEWPSL